MLRKIIALTLAAFALTACADLRAGHGQAWNESDYCLTGTDQGCDPMQGAPDCQPCSPLHRTAN
jgi:hypothetical protein